VVSRVKIQAEIDKIGGFGMIPDVSIRLMQATQRNELEEWIVQLACQSKRPFTMINGFLKVAEKEGGV